MGSYSSTSLADSIAEAGIAQGDTISLQVSLGRLGLPDGANTIPSIVKLVIDAVLDALGESGTLIVPTYTYSIGRGTPYEVEKTPSEIGEFTEAFRTIPGVIRSRDPMLSNCGIGPKAHAVLRDISHSCCGEGSAFHNLRKHNAKICTLGLGLYYATFIQHIEEMFAVPFRMHKQFTGTVIESAVKSEETWTYFAAPYLDNCVPNPLAMEVRAKQAGIVKLASVGRGQLVCVDANSYFDFGFNELARNPWLTAKGPPCSENLIRRHMSREND